MAEHSCVRNTCRWLKRHHGFEITEISSGPDGAVNVEQLKNSLRPETALVSIQHINSETGAINPLDKIGKLLADHPAKYHSDCVQSFCKLDIKPADWNLDSLTISAHKVHGPKGFGACYIHPRVRWEPFIPETNQERGFRPGTADVPGVVAFAAAAREQAGEQAGNFERVKNLKSRFIDLLRDKAGNSIHIEADPDHSSPYICGLRV